MVFSTELCAAAVTSHNDTNSRSSLAEQPAENVCPVTRLIEANNASVGAKSPSLCTYRTIYSALPSAVGECLFKELAGASENSRAT